MSWIFEDRSSDKLHSFWKPWCLSYALPFRLFFWANLWWSTQKVLQGNHWRFFKPRQSVFILKINVYLFEPIPISSFFLVSPILDNQRVISLRKITTKDSRVDHNARAASFSRKLKDPYGKSPVPTKPYPAADETPPLSILTRFVRLFIETLEFAV